MVQIVGKYENVSSENFDDYLKAMGANDDVVKMVGSTKPLLEIKQAGEQWTVIVTNIGKESSSTFKLGEPYDEQMPNGAALKSVTRREGDKFITESDLPEGNKSTRVYEFNNDGIVVHLSDKKSGKKASRTYKRI